jgi:phosphoglycerol transferase MdoB-like AlkP superfamily enzyme
MISRLFSLSALCLPPLILAQSFLAGLAIFHDGAIWGQHGLLGGLISLPVLILAGLPWLTRDLRPLRWWGLALLLVYLVHILLAGAAANDMTFIAALHPPNALSLIALNLVLLLKIGRFRRSEKNPE